MMEQADGRADGAEADAAPTPTASARACATEFRLGEGLVGQCAFEKDRILITDVPGDYVRINSGLGRGRRR